ncbi:glutathione S-transferase family protein [Marinagarivorans cellulosilyticus]|uniref:Glutathione S-transferase n=1 Tax=Marinagarivorans cellulosilyticus TaxID=2721545 RepID=A0AAN1WF62_9GAMM|nr:glutathione S-transferase [Marinagarivorans cellulosilyticus]BCD96488.1 glutathione S-transferase [Marinagarivorans cellulosilyticus]
MSQPLKIYSFPLSGHAHRVRLFASVAGIPHEVIDVDLAAGEQRQAPFLNLNPFGQVPVIQDGDITLADSNAILFYLAKKYAPQYLPKDPVQEAQVQQFLSFAAGELAFGPATARLITVFGAPLDAQLAISRAHNLFAKLNQHLASRGSLVGDHLTIADFALYTYTAHAPEGNVDLAEYPEIKRWLAGIEALEGFIPMKSTAVGLAA